ncbi:hypothetical protein SEA_JUJU_76 [Gordonia phage JuJu]|uniref:DUF4326 domain-containing protein n=1 Tax=Gordonia phage JuJu TaxID=2590929 RepID=A0A516KR72_9CAUD|nr:hypothetical protein KNU69_gp76 [Gordonia phage JuJu]QDP44192.1 hypothetical protein SEA_JUJU_76 [Gordonia phage JuJu]
MMPQRIQRKRTKGWRMPEGAVSVARPSRFGNPFTVEMAADADMDDPRRVCVSFFRAWLEGSDELRDVYDAGATWSPAYDRRWVLAHLGDLRGRDLACFCPLDQPCHADVLLELANGGDAR